MPLTALNIIGFLIVAGFTLFLFLTMVNQEGFQQAVRSMLIFALVVAVYWFGWQLMVGNVAFNGG